MICSRSRRSEGDLIENAANRVFDALDAFRRFPSQSADVVGDEREATARFRRRAPPPPTPLTASMLVWIVTRAIGFHDLLDLRPDGIQLHDRRQAAAGLFERCR